MLTSGGKHPSLSALFPKPSSRQKHLSHASDHPEDDHPSRPAFASCVEQYLTHPGQRVHFHNDKLSSRLDDILQTAIEEQNLIGWHQLLLGYLSKKWLLLAAMDTPTPGN
ncbi:hypothetical protein MHU86_6119 [Fragilaria crotonensis]|nr:hypothetical protein MHU86_6119 [Fragilaria crotonensis]